MQLIPNDDIHFGDDERHVLVDLLERAINPRNDGSPTWVLPEPGKSTKRRFGRDREIDTGYSAVYSILGPGKRHADDPIVINLNWSTPEPLDEANPAARCAQISGVVATRLRGHAWVFGGLDRRCSLDHRLGPHPIPARHTAGSRRPPAHWPVARTWFGDVHTVKECL